jgi:DNA-binding cell septation regulator SpoVG
VTARHPFRLSARARSLMVELAALSCDLFEVAVNDLRGTSDNAGPISLPSKRSRKGELRAPTEPVSAEATEEARDALTRNGFATNKRKP